jgi:hypothetical protein
VKSASIISSAQTINPDSYVATLTELKARICGGRPENKTTFLLQDDNSRPHTSLKIMEHVGEFG